MPAANPCFRSLEERSVTRSDVILVMLAGRRITPAD
jgi:hypothetical protein